jgi:hypothetical protein
MPDRVCLKCGADPSLGVLEAPADDAPPATETQPDSGLQAGFQDSRRGRGGRRAKRPHLMLKLVVGWSLVLVLIVIGARFLWYEEDAERQPAAPSSKTTTLSNEDIFFLNEAAPKCSEVFSGFLAAGTPESRNQFVLAPITTSSRMARFYSLNSLPNVDPGRLSLADNGLLNLPGGKAVESCWQSLDGRKIEAVFREENGEWRLDWDHFARYSDYPWALFLAGSGESEGEFRLLVRERLAEERKAADALSLVFYAPRFGQPGEAGFQSPEFLVSRNNRDGKLLDAAFKLARSGGRVFGSQLPNLNPEGMIRVRVKVRRFEVDMERKFEIVKVLACHWYSVDEPGVEPADATVAPAAQPPQAR